MGSLIFQLVKPKCSFKATLLGIWKGATREYQPKTRSEFEEKWARYYNPLLWPNNTLVYILKNDSFGERSGTIQGGFLIIKFLF